MKLHAILLGLLFCLSSITCEAAEPLKIGWDDLVPKLAAKDNPLASLNDVELEYVEWLIYLRQTLPEEVDPINQELYDELNKALPMLERRGIDIDVVIAQRKIRDYTMNKELDGKMVTLSGYLLPLDLSGDKVTDFLLLPYVGACIHTPPPPPNQIVVAKSDSPTSLDADTIFKPVTVQGRLTAKSLSKNLFLVDGSADIDIGYTMSVEKIEDYKQQ